MLASPPTPFIAIFALSVWGVALVSLAVVFDVIYCGSLPVSIVAVLAFILFLGLLMLTLAVYEQFGLYAGFVAVIATSAGGVALIYFADDCFFAPACSLIGGSVLMMFWATVRFRHQLSPLPEEGDNV